MKRFFCVSIVMLMISNLLGILYVKDYVLASSEISQEYIVDNMDFWTGESIAVNISEANYVSADITRCLEYEDNDMLIFAFYTDSGELITIYSQYITTDYGVTTNIKVPIIIEEDKILGEVRVFIWNDFDDLIPVSNRLSSKNGWNTRFEVVPSPDDENVDESDDIYEIPSIFDGEIPTIVPSDGNEELPEIPGKDDVIEFNQYISPLDELIDSLENQCGF